MTMALQKVEYQNYATATFDLSSVSVIHILKIFQARKFMLGTSFLYFQKIYLIAFMGQLRNISSSHFLNDSMMNMMMTMTMMGFSRNTRSICLNAWIEQQAVLSTFDIFAIRHIPRGESYGGAYCATKMQRITF